MLTVGQILKKARIEKKIPLEDIEKKTKIRKKFLEALEKEEWEKLPSLPYIKGFISNYSNYLGLKPGEMLAIFRRQFTEKEKARLLPSGLSEPLNEPIFRLTPQKIFISTAVFLLFVFFAYLFMQFKSLTGTPYLSVASPKEGEVVNGNTVIILGKTDSENKVSINNQNIQTDEKGNFRQELNLPQGINIITVSAQNKFGKESSLKRTIQLGNP
ncbi:MAG: hypothetical protein UU37_C0002G0069 [Candidatus Gottesmanbacteria bacterium GW2011_GWA2_41_12]|uniref:Transcriptional regulator, XRE family n=2 Tax=Candidatus Gottesmaniibacteriota TaxID=1752720 RepID=A0A0G0UIA4_9BACT|nr:MAG: hypothetical protein UT63_C0084G0005 [Candidatus Gottesmanbacteria bacterium GW2011_GWC2_39_8]KKR88554.1 MAG: hypothetical protein UU37_C0002G0069 [Candidatus Gottesmanbacteria bacterium GW2011_GWA2_41_12]